MKTASAKFFGMCLAAVLAFSVALTGCNRNGKTKLSVINYRPEDQAFYSYVVEEFERENPDVDVVYEAVSTEQYASLMTSRLQARSADVFGTEAANVGSDAVRKYMLPLDDLKNADGASIWNDIVDASKKECMFEGSYLVAPLSQVTMLVFYNKDIINASNGFDFYSNGKYPVTWSEFERTMLLCQQKVNTKEIDGVFMYGGQSAWPMSMITCPIEVATVRSLDPDYYLKLVKEEAGYDFGSASYTDFFTKLKGVCSYIDPKMAGMDYALAPSMFATGKYAMTIDGSWSLAQVLKTNPDMNVGFFPLPVNDSAEYNTLVPYKTATAWAVDKDSKNIELAKKFIEFQYRPDIYERYINSMGGMSVVKGITNSSDKAKEMFAFDTILTCENMWPSGLLADADTLRTIGNDFIAGKGSVEEAISKMNTIMNNSRSKWTDEKVSKSWLQRFYPEEL